jgi:hypothetical protein
VHLHAIWHAVNGVIELLFITWNLFLVSLPPQMVRTTATATSQASALRYKARVEREVEQMQQHQAKVQELRLLGEVKDCVNGLVNSVVAIDADSFSMVCASSSVVVSSASARHMCSLDFSRPLVDQLDVVQHIPGLVSPGSHLPSQGAAALANGGQLFRGQNACERAGLGTEPRPRPLKRNADSCA